MRTIPESFLVAFSFAGEQRALVHTIAAAVESRLGPGTVFYDDWFEHWLAGADADLKLQSVYGERCILAVVCVSARYGDKAWTQAEHRAIRARQMRADLSMRPLDREAILPIRVGDGDVPGILFNAIVPDVRQRSSDESADLIIERLRLLRPELKVHSGDMVSAQESDGTESIPGDEPLDSDAETADSDCHCIVRPADRAVRALASRCGLTLVIKGPEEMGKSRLLTAFLSHCQRHGKACACVDFSAFSRADLSEYSTFLSLLAATVKSELGQDLGEPPVIGSQREMNLFIERSILAPLASGLALGLDEVDRILGRPYQVDFFSMLRSWHNARTPLKPMWRKLDMAMVISTEPYLLIDDDHRSPFNVGEIIEIGPLTIDECFAINRRYGCVLQSDEVRQLWSLLGGQPSLTQTAFKRLTAPDRIAFESLINSAAEPHGPFGAHLRKLSTRLHKAPELQAALRQIIDHGTRPEQSLCDRLAGAGLVRWEAGRVMPANRLYALYFGSMI